MGREIIEGRGGLYSLLDVCQPPWLPGFYGVLMLRMGGVGEYQPVLTSADLEEPLTNVTRVAHNRRDDAQLFDDKAFES
jgi:hypothetical protein